MMECWWEFVDGKGAQEREVSIRDVSPSILCS